MSTVTMSVELTVEAYQKLVRLRDTGLYGHRVEDAAERVICRWLEQVERESLVPLERHHDGPCFPGCGCES